MELKRNILKCIVYTNIDTSPHELSNVKNGNIKTFLHNSIGIQIQAFKSLCIL